MFSQETTNSLPVRPILYGSMITMLLTLIVILMLAFLTELGWQGLIKWAPQLYLGAIYFGVVLGGVFAGKRSATQGWLSGLGVGLLTSTGFLLLAVLSDLNFHWGYFLIKTILGGLVGCCGGIIGVNLAEPERN